MPDKRKKLKESQYLNSEIEDFEVRDPAESSVEELLHSMIKSFMDSVVTNHDGRLLGLLLPFGSKFNFWLTEG